MPPPAPQLLSCWSSLFSRASGAGTSDLVLLGLLSLCRIVQYLALAYRTLCRVFETPRSHRLREKAVGSVCYAHGSTGGDLSLVSSCLCFESCVVESIQGKDI